MSTAIVPTTKFVPRTEFTATPVGGLTVFEGHEYSPDNPLAVTVADGYLHIEFPYLVMVPTITGRNRIPRDVRMEGRMRFTMPVVDTEPLTRDDRRRRTSTVAANIDVDPANGDYWAHRINTGFPASGGSDDGNEVIARLWGDGQNREFAKYGMHAHVPFLIQQFLPDSMRFPRGLRADFTDFLNEVATRNGDGYGHITDPQAVPDVLARSAQSTAIVGAATLAATEHHPEGEWVLLAPVDEPVVVVDEGGFLDLGYQGQATGRGVITVRLTDPWVQAHIAAKLGPFYDAFTLSDTADKYLNAPTHEQAVVKARNYLAECHDRLQDTTRNPKGDPDQGFAQRVLNGARYANDRSHWQVDMEMAVTEVVVASRKLRALLNTVGGDR